MRIHANRRREKPVRPDGLHNDLETGSASHLRRITDGIRLRSPRFAMRFHEAVGVLQGLPQEEDDAEAVAEEIQGKLAKGAAEGLAEVATEGAAAARAARRRAAIFAARAACDEAAIWGFAVGTLRSCITTNCSSEDGIVEEVHATLEGEGDHQFLDPAHDREQPPCHGPQHKPACDVHPNGDGHEDLSENHRNQHLAQSKDAARAADLAAEYALQEHHEPPAAFLDHECCLFIHAFQRIFFTFVIFFHLNNFKNNTPHRWCVNLHNIGHADLDDHDSEGEDETQAYDSTNVHETCVLRCENARKKHHENEDVDHAPGPAPGTQSAPNVWIFDLGQVFHFICFFVHHLKLRGLRAFWARFWISLHAVEMGLDLLTRLFNLVVRQT